MGEQLAGHVKSIMEAVERERQERLQDFGDVKSGLMELRSDVDEACQVTLTLSKVLNAEGTEREEADEDIRHQLDELRIKLDEVVSVRQESVSRPPEFKSVIGSFFS